MAAFAVDQNNDLLLTAGKLTVLTGAAAAAVQLTHRFRLFRGGWFLDTRLGVPYLERVMLKNPDLGNVQALFRKVALTVQGVTAVEFDTFELDKATRVLNAVIRCTYSDGTQIVGGPGAPFIVTEGVS